MEWDRLGHSETLWALGPWSPARSRDGRHSGDRDDSPARTGATRRIRADPWAHSTYRVVAIGSGCRCKTTQLPHSASLSISDRVAFGEAKVKGIATDGSPQEVGSSSTEGRRSRWARCLPVSSGRGDNQALRSRSGSLRTVDTGRFGRRSTRSGTSALPPRGALGQPFN
jgi:hypothetical protein